MDSVIIHIKITPTQYQYLPHLFGSEGQYESQVSWDCQGDDHAVEDGQERLCGRIHPRRNKYIIFHYF